MKLDRWGTLNQALRTWATQFHPEIKLEATGNRWPHSTKSGEFISDVHNFGLRSSKFGDGLKPIVLWQKGEIRKGVVIATDLEGRKWQQGANGFTEIVPKRQLSQASKLKNRYRRGLITYPRQIAKLEASIEELKLEQPIVEAERNRLYTQLLAKISGFEKTYDIVVKPYPYHQSIARFASKLGGEKFAIMSHDFWELRHMRVRSEELGVRSRFIGRRIRAVERKLEVAKLRQKKLSHGQDPNKKLSWEK